jgi:hypothetical protein
MIINIILLLNCITLKGKCNRINEMKESEIDNIYNKMFAYNIELYKNRDLLYYLDNEIKKENIMLLFSESTCTSCISECVCDLSILAETIGHDNIVLIGVYQKKEVFEKHILVYNAQDHFKTKYVSSTDVVISSYPLIRLENKDGEKVITLSYEEYKRNRNRFRDLVKYVYNEKI